MVLDSVIHRCEESSKTQHSFTKERHGSVGIGPEERQRNGQRAETPLQEEKLRVWVVQPGEEKAPGSLQYLNGGYKTDEDDIFIGAFLNTTGTIVMVIN